MAHIRSLPWGASQAMAAETRLLTSDPKPRSYRSAFGLGTRDLRLGIIGSHGLGFRD